MTEQNKAIALRWSEELWSKGDLAVADEIVAADYVRHDPGDPFPAQGPEDVKRIVRMLRSMLPDLRISVDAMSAWCPTRRIAASTQIVARLRGWHSHPPFRASRRVPRACC